MKILTILDYFFELLLFELSIVLFTHTNIFYSAIIENRYDEINLYNDYLFIIGCIYIKLFLNFNI